MEAIIRMLDPDQHKKIAWLHTEMKSLGIEAMKLSMLTWPDYTADFIGVYGEAIIRIAQELHSEVLELLQIMTEEERQALTA
ncbi:hypothetical protein [Deinococcus roseus]|uniref:Uncharacterized protein n=1 Tax=Deinococcus roseus TaxID=392414 RepID=A0ABQ2DJZ3_9DEIO|nr:hypothetical protein [Deinococcus roseus]GGJ60132.1 hypothetical protein GCM10008938_52840 [Deinococcus roseus]